MIALCMTHQKSISSLNVPRTSRRIVPLNTTPNRLAVPQSISRSTALGLDPLSSGRERDRRVDLPSPESQGNPASGFSRREQTAAECEGTASIEDRNVPTLSARMTWPQDPALADS